MRGPDRRILGAGGRLRTDRDIGVAYELLDTGAFDEDRYWIVDTAYAKADPLDVLMRVRVTNAGPDAETLHVLPTAWFRNTWSWAELLRRLAAGTPAEGLGDLSGLDPMDAASLVMSAPT